MNDSFTAEARLCDDSGMVSHEVIPEGNPGTHANPGLTYIQLLNNLRNASGHARYEGEPFHCTGSAHLAYEHFRCTSPAHVPQNLDIGLNVSRLVEDA